MSTSALFLFSGFLWIQQGTILSQTSVNLDFGASVPLNDTSQTIIGLVTIALTIIVGALYWKSGKWQGPDQVDF